MANQTITRTNISPVWHFFTILITNLRFATCKICKAKQNEDPTSDVVPDIPRGGVLQNNWGTTNLKNHLKKKHSHEWDEHLNALEQAKLQAPKINQHFKPKSKQKSQTVRTMVESCNTQPTLLQTIEKKKKWARSDKRSIELTKTIAEYLALAIMPFNHVASYAFKHLMERTIPNYDLPAPTYFSRKIIPSMYICVKKSVKYIVSKASYISFTSDLWTSKYTQDTFIAFTGHCISDDGAVQTVLLACRYFPKRHTSENITSMIISMIAEYDIPKEKIGAIITDNAPNIIKGAKDTGHHSFGCILHQIQLVINKAILHIVGIKSMIDKCRSIVTFVHKSSSAKETLKLIQEGLGAKTKRLIQECPTR